MNAVIWHISPWKVRVPEGQFAERDIRTQAERLESEGQIEPVEITRHETSPVHGTPATYYTLDDDGWFYAGAQAGMGNHPRVSDVRRGQ